MITSVAKVFAFTKHLKHTQKKKKISVKSRARTDLKAQSLLFLIQVRFKSIDWFLYDQTLVVNKLKC